MFKRVATTPLGYGETYGRGRNWYIEAKLNWKRNFGPADAHKVSAMVLYNQSRNYYPATFTYIPRSYIGYVARATYSYADRYYLDVNLGYNGSENFAPGKTLRTFPVSFSRLGCDRRKIHEERAFSRLFEDSRFIRPGRK